MAVGGWRLAVPEFSDRRASWFGHMLTVAATIDFGFSFSTAADTEVTGPKNNISDEHRPEKHLYLYGAPKPGLSNSLASQHPLRDLRCRSRLRRNVGDVQTESFPALFILDVDGGVLAVFSLHVASRCFGRHRRSPEISMRHESLAGDCRRYAGGPRFAPPAKSLSYSGLHFPDWSRLRLQCPGLDIGGAGSGLG